MQSNHSMAEYITKFDEFLVRCGENESDIVVLSRFRSGLRGDHRRELFVQNIFILEHDYQLVQDLDCSQCFSFSKHTDYRDNNKATTIKSQPSQSRFQSHLESSNSTQKYDDKGKKVYSESSRSIQQNRCFKCQGFDHIDAQCTNKTKTLIIAT